MTHAARPHGPATRGTPQGPRLGLVPTSDRGADRPAGGGDGPPPTPAQATAWLRGLLAAGLTDVPGTDDDPALAALLTEAASLAGECLADHTLRAYGGAWSRWAVWCDDRRLRPLPADPLHVAAYAAWLYTRDRPLRPSSVSAQLGAINTAHRLAGLAEPAAGGPTAAVQKGARRRHGTAPLGAKDALTLDLLRPVLAAAVTDPGRLRDAALVALHAAGLTPPRAVATTWDLVVPVSDDWEVRPPDGGPPVRVVATGLPGCPAAAVAAARPEPPAGPVTRVPDPHDSGPRADRPMTRQGVVQVLRRTAVAAAVPVPDHGPPPLAGPDHGDHADRVLRHLARPGPAELRDRCALLVGWTGALRRSGLAALDWTDLTPDPTTGEIRVDLRKQKNDPDGHGHVLWLVPRTDPDLCPVRALASWREVLARLLGHDPADRPGLPLLVRLTTAGRPARGPHTGTARLSPAAVHDLVTRTARRAGHAPGRYGSHSLRSGWITEAAGTEGVTAFDIQQVSGHQLLESVLRYVRPVNARRRNPNRLIGT